MNEILIKHYENPCNRGKLEEYNVIGTVGNESCGDRMDVYLKIDGDIITDISYYTFGCGSAVATASLMSEMIKGKSLEYAYKLTSKEALDIVSGHKSLPNKKHECASLIEKAIKDAIEKYYEKSNRPDYIDG